MVGYDLPGLVCVRRINDGFARDETVLALQVHGGGEIAARVYAHKVLDGRDQRRFETEIAALQVLADEPHILTPVAAGVTDTGHAYVATAYCVAGSLHDHLIAVGRFTPAEVRRIGAKLADALGQAHTQGVFHRNIKPANILITGAGEPALSDFGLVALETADGDYAPPLTPTQRAYAAPEAFLPELMSAAADIYSLGATMYALLAGWAPRASDPFAIAIDGDTLVDLPRVPWALMTVVRRAMALDPQERFADAFELRNALTAIT